MAKKQKTKEKHDFKDEAVENDLSLDDAEPIDENLDSSSKNTDEAESFEEKISEL